MDVDIDVSDVYSHGGVFPHATRASQIVNGELRAHNVGVYFQNIPVDKETGFSAIPFRFAEAHGFLKIDLLHLSLLDCVRSKEEFRFLSNKEPNWDRLEDPKFVHKLFQLGNHYDTVSKIKPRSVLEIADCIAIIRPGVIRLLSEYLRKPAATRKKIYKLGDNKDKYKYKKSHAIAYALDVVVNMHLIEMGRI